MDGDLFDLPRVLIVASVWVGTNCFVSGAPTLETKWFSGGLSCVHTRGSENKYGEDSHSVSARLATGVCTTLPRGLNMASDAI